MAAFQLPSLLEKVTTFRSRFPLLAQQQVAVSWSWATSVEAKNNYP